MKATHLCSFPDCGAQRVAQGLCAGHRSQMKRGVGLTPIDRTPPPKACSFGGCDHKHYQVGLCRGHYDQRRRGVDLRPLEPRGRVGCEVDGCERPHSAKGYCSMHYRRLRLYGNPETLLVITDARERFESFIDRTETCWLWTGSLTYDGYGIFREDNRRTGAHRFAYEYLIGPVPDGMQLDHLCRVRNCVNPEHLEPVTGAENTRRAFEARRLELKP